MTKTELFSETSRAVELKNISRRKYNKLISDFYVHYGIIDQLEEQLRKNYHLGLTKASYENSFVRPNLSDKDFFKTDFETREKIKNEFLLLENDFHFLFRELFRDGTVLYPQTVMQDILESFFWGFTVSVSISKYIYEVPRFLFMKQKDVFIGYTFTAVIIE